MRSKELSNDYRYFPDPDLLPVHLDEAFIESVRETLPELPAEKQARYEAEYALSEYDASFLTQDPDLAEYFEDAAKSAGDAKLAANWVMGELSAALNRDELGAAECPLPPAILGSLIQRIQDGTISGKIAKEVFEIVESNCMLGIHIGVGDSKITKESRNVKKDRKFAP